MRTFDEFCVRKNRTLYPATEKFPDGYVGVMVYADEYAAIQSEARKELALEFQKQYGNNDASRLLLTLI